LHSTLIAAYWWGQFGGSCSELKNFAIRILSQPCSASGCERNWSVFERIHTKKRNRLEHKRLNDMVYVQYNLRLRRNQLLNRTPASGNITLDDFDPSSEWVVETQAPVFDNEDLSWLDLDPPPEVPSSGPGESSGAQNPTPEEDEEDEDDDEEDDDE